MVCRIFQQCRCTVDALYAHIRNKHHFECTICYNVSHTAEELEEHIKEKHGGFQPSEQEIQAQRRGEERLEREKRKKGKAEAEARRTAYFPCKECVEGFSTKRELDKHTTDKHIFICGECLKTFKTKAERDAHMKTDHKEVTTQMTKQEKLLAEEYRKRESREEKDRRAKETWEKVWTEYAIKKSKQEAEESRQRKRKPSATQTKEPYQEKTSPMPQVDVGKKKEGPTCLSTPTTGQHSHATQTGPTEL